MSNLLTSAINSVLQSEAAWCRYITANDTGSTGSHQAGFYVPKYASKLFFDEPGRKGENKEKSIRIVWQNDFHTDSSVKYYGQGSRNEYRITRFGKKFPLLQDDNVGDLMILAKQADTEYAGFVLREDDDIDAFCSYFNISAANIGNLIDIRGLETSENAFNLLINQTASQFGEFPSTATMAECARTCYDKTFKISDTDILTNPDDLLLKWLDTEYSLFKAIENNVYADLVNKPFNSVESFIQSANLVLNRRKSRAGKSLEHHLANIFSRNSLVFEEQVITENNKKPDFVFPNGRCYHDFSFPAGNLTMLGVKTTCKDRWRQIISEADRVEIKYLFTTQQALSRNQLSEMTDAKVRLVVPSKFISNYPQEYRAEINSLHGFIQIVKDIQSRLPKHYFV